MIAFVYRRGHRADVYFVRKVGFSEINDGEGHFIDADHIGIVGKFDFRAFLIGNFYVSSGFKRFGKSDFARALLTAGVWSIVMGVFFAIAQKNEDKEKARKMIKNYVIGLVVIFAILVACPYLVKGIAALIAG